MKQQPKQSQVKLIQAEKKQCLKGKMTFVYTILYHAIFFAIF